MSGFEIALIGIAILLAMLVIRIPVAVAMLAVGVVGYMILSGVGPLLNYAKTAVYWRFSSYDLSIVPMFLLMGQFAGKAGLSRALFDSANAFLGHRRDIDRLRGIPPNAESIRVVTGHEVDAAVGHDRRAVDFRNRVIAAHEFLDVE